MNQFVLYTLSCFFISSTQAISITYPPIGIDLTNSLEYGVEIKSTNEFGHISIEMRIDERELCDVESVDISLFNPIKNKLDPFIAGLEIGNRNGIYSAKVSQFVANQSWISIACKGASEKEGNYRINNKS